MGLVIRHVIWCYSRPVGTLARRNASYLEQKMMEKIRKLKHMHMLYNEREYLVHYN